MLELYKMDRITIRIIYNLIIQIKTKIWRFLGKRKNVHLVKSAES